MNENRQTQFSKELPSPAATRQDLVADLAIYQGAYREGKQPSALTSGKDENVRLFGLSRGDATDFAQ